MPRKRGKKPLADPPIEKTLSLPGSLVVEVELRLYDPTTGKARYGAFAQLVERLLREWLTKGAPDASTPSGGNPPDSTPRPQENPGDGQDPGGAA